MSSGGIRERFAELRPHAAIRNRDDHGANTPMTAAAIAAASRR